MISKGFEINTTATGTKRQNGRNAWMERVVPPFQSPQIEGNRVQKNGEMLNRYRSEAFPSRGDSCVCSAMVKYEWSGEKVKGRGTRDEYSITAW